MCLHRKCSILCFIVYMERFVILRFVHGNRKTNYRLALQGQSYLIRKKKDKKHACIFLKLNHSNAINDDISLYKLYHIFLVSMISRDI